MDTKLDTKTRKPTTKLSLTEFSDLVSKQRSPDVQIVLAQKYHLESKIEFGYAPGDFPENQIAPARNRLGPASS